MKPRWTGGAYLALPRLFDGSDRRIGGRPPFGDGYPATLPQPQHCRLLREKMRAFLGCSVLTPPSYSAA